MKDGDEMNVDTLLEEFGAVPITVEEARSCIKGKKLKFKLAKGAEMTVSDLERMRMRTRKDAWTNIPIAGRAEQLKGLVDRKKSELPMFAFNGGGKTNALVLDIENDVTMRNVEEALKDFAYITYYSASSTVEKPRLRVVIPFDQEVKDVDFDFCKDKFIAAFSGIPDPHSFESRRWYYWPSAKCGEYRELNVVKFHEGHSLDFYETTGYDVMTKLKKQMERSRQAASIRSVADDDRVQYYLSTDFPMITGNGDSASSLYTAVVVCLAHGDKETLEEVLSKASQERWTEAELRRVVANAEKFLEKRR